MKCPSGVFVCQTSIFDATAESCSAGDTTLSGGVGRLASRGLIHGVDIDKIERKRIDSDPSQVAPEPQVQPLVI